MKFSKEDFTLDRIDRPDGHEDYWFNTSEKADKMFCITPGINEQGIQHVFEVVYSKDEDVVGIKRQFLFNWDVLMNDDNELKSLLRDLANESQVNN